MNPEVETCDGCGQVIPDDPDEILEPLYSKDEWSGHWRCRPVGETP